jgi:lysophospholipase L1-like esterase
VTSKEAERAASIPPEPAGSGVRRSFRWALAAAIGSWALFAIGTFPQVAIPLAASILLGLLAWKASRERSRRIAINVLVFTVMLGAADLALRRFANGLLYHRFHDRYSRVVPDFPSLSRYEQMVDVTLQERGDLGSMTGDPHLWEPRPVRFVTDQLGFRNAPMSPEPYDLLVVGDSFVVGIGTSQEDLFVEQLRRSRRTYQLAMPGGPRDGYAQLALLRDAIPLKPGGTLLWVIFPGNDFDDRYEPLDLIASHKSSRISRAAVAFKTWRQRSFVGHVLRRIVVKGNGNSVLVREHAGNKVLFYSMYESTSRRTVEQWAKHPNAKEFLSTLDAMRQLAREMKLQVTLAIMPPKEEVYRWILDPSSNPDEAPSEFVRYLTPLAQERGIPIIDLGPELGRQGRELAAKGTYLYWRDDTHLNAAGHGAVARILLQALPSTNGKDPSPK